MKKPIVVLSVGLFLSFAAKANWEGLTEANYACGPKLTAEQLKGKVVLVDMWATWCGPCRQMMPHTLAIAKKYRARGLVTIGSHAERGYSKDGVANLAKSQGWDFSFYKEARWTGDNIGFDGGIPFLYVVDKKGKVVYHGRNPQAVEEAIVAALGQSGGATFLDENELVMYKNLRQKLLPGKNVENILKNLKTDIERGTKHPENATFVKRKDEAVKITAAVQEYKTDLLASIDAELEGGKNDEARKHIDLLTATWPSLKREWAPKRKALGK